MLQVKNVKVKLGGKEILKGISFSLTPGSMVCVAGPNGAGKSILFYTIAGYFKPYSGEVLINGEKVHSLTTPRRAELISFLPQRTSFFYPFKVREVVEMGSYRFKSPDGERAMALVGILPMAEREFTSLSEGERKLVLIARLLAQQTPILLLDEPASNLDINRQVKIYSLLRKLAENGRTILVSEHSLNLLPFCNRAILMKEGRIVSRGLPGEVLKDEILERVYDIHPSELVRILP